MAKKVTTKKASAKKETVVEEIPVTESVKEELNTNIELDNAEEIAENAEKEIETVNEEIDKIMSAENPDTEAIAEVLNNLSEKEEELKKAEEVVRNEKEKLNNLFRSGNFNNFWNGSSNGWYN